MTTYKDFTDFLKEKWPAEGVLDDDMPEAFDHWLTQLDNSELIDYADLYAEEVRLQEYLKNNEN